MAFEFPDSRFVGIDLSPVQVEIGRGMSGELSLTNIELIQADILELKADALERFDYIIVHGVYSWVPPAVQERILSLCRNHLDENGLAYVSYNTYPGWCGKQALRQMLRHHTRQIDDPREKVAAALELIQVLPGSKTMPGDPAAILADRLRSDLQKIGDPAAYLIHEYLIDSNQPLYFREFLERIESSGLRYVDDAYPGGSSPDRLPPAGRQWIEEHLTDPMERQQYIDFVGNVSFRRSLLCLRERALESGMTFACMQTLHVAATCNREESDDGTPRFRTDPGLRFSAGHPGMAAILNSLVDARPASIPVNELRRTLGEDVAEGEVAAMLSGLQHAAAVEFVSTPRRCTPTVGDRPRASGLVRYQARSDLVTSAAHRPVRLRDAFERHLVQLLDGEHTVPELTALIRTRLKPDQPISDAKWDTLVRGRLEWLVRRGLLE